jgi:hypothetical protein
MQCKLNHNTSFLIDEMYANSIILTAIDKDQVQSMDASCLIGFVEILPESATVALKFAGYEDDPREVWEVPEVRDFVKKTLTQAPEILPRFTLIHRRMLRSCILDLVRVPFSNGRVLCPPSPLWDQIAHAAGVNPLE